MPGSTPHVGIVLRTKNRPWFLRRALADIAAQTYDSWSLQIVNDGGDQDVVDRSIAEQSEDFRARTSVRHNVESHGRSAAANEGLRALETRFVVLHDDDDLWHPEFLARTAAWLDRNPDAIGVVARTEIVQEAANPDGEGFVEVDRALFWPDLSEILFTDLLVINRAVPISFLYRRAAHEDVGFYREDLDAAEDWEFYLRIAVKHRIGFLDGEPLAYWMHRQEVSGELGNSMFVLADEHDRFDRRIRDDALRSYAEQFGPGLPLYLVRLVEETVRAELDRRPSDLDRIMRRLPGWARFRRRR